MTGVRRCALHLLWMLIFSLLGACAAARPQAPGASSDVLPEPQPTLPQVDLCIRDGGHWTMVRAERATRPAERRMGLMSRQYLAENAGMLFVYPQERSGDRGFWMYQTPLPLAIAYLDREGEIVALRQMEPCLRQAQECPSYPPGVPYWKALEVNAGFFAAHGIGVGGRVTETPTHSAKRCAVEPVPGTQAGRVGSLN